MDLEQLNVHLRNLAVLNETDDPMISCYVNIEAGRSSYRSVIDSRIRDIRKSLQPKNSQEFEDALSRIEAFLFSSIHQNALGLAVFSRAGEHPFFRALQFRLSLPSLIEVDSVPHIYELVKLKDTYHRYIVLISTETFARIIEVNVGEVTKQLWTERPQVRQRIGREWTKDHYQNHRRDRTQKFINEKVGILNRLMANGVYGHLILAGNPRVIARMRDNLPKHLLQRLVDEIPTSGNDSVKDIVNATLTSFAEFEQSESLETAALLMAELRTSGLAVAGTDATLTAVTRGQVDILLMSDSYEAPDGWKCSGCGFLCLNSAPQECLQCGGTFQKLDVKEEIIRVSQSVGNTVEVIRNSDVLSNIGGVGCLLRYLAPEQSTMQDLPPRLPPEKILNTVNI